MQQNKSLLPISIIIAGVLIASALYFGGNKGTPQTADVSGALKEPVLAEVTAKDHILGNASAPVKIVVYTDFECPFCKQFHSTMEQVMNEYGKSGKIAWVYRNFPIDQLHPIKARKEAMAVECASEQGGNEAFWKFTDRIFELTLSNNQTDVDTILPQIAREIELKESEFKTCLESKKFNDRIEEDIESGVTAGARGTPYTVLVDSKGKLSIINGAQPYENVKAAIEQALGN